MDKMAVGGVSGTMLTLPVPLFKSTDLGEGVVCELKDFPIRGGGLLRVLPTGDPNFSVKRGRVTESSTRGRKGGSWKELGVCLTMPTSLSVQLMGVRTLLGVAALLRGGAAKVAAEMGVEDLTTT